MSVKVTGRAVRSGRTTEVDVEDPSVRFQLVEVFHPGGDGGPGEWAGWGALEFDPESGGVRVLTVFDDRADAEDSLRTRARQVRKVPHLAG